MTPSDICNGLEVGHGLTWYRVALTLERAANDGQIEIRVSGNRRKFRRGRS